MVRKAFVTERTLGRKGTESLESGDSMGHRLRRMGGIAMRQMSLKAAHRWVNLSYKS